MDELIAFSLELDRTHLDWREANMKKVIAIDDEMHSNCGLGIAECGIGSKIRNPRSEFRNMFIGDNPTTPYILNFFPLRYRKRRIEVLWLLGLACLRRSFDRPLHG